MKKEAILAPGENEKYSPLYSYAEVAKLMKHVKTILKACLAESLTNGGCGECQASCQSACKTSCTVANQVCAQKKAETK